MAKTNVVHLPQTGAEVTVDDMIRQCVDVANAVLDGALSPVKADKVIRASAVAAKWTEMRIKYGDGGRIVLSKRSA